MNRRRFSVLLTAAPAACAIAESTQPLRVRALSFNIRFRNAGDTDKKNWQARRGPVIDVIRREAADVVGLQEALRSQLDDLRESLGDDYLEIGVGREDGKTKGEYAALLIRRDRWKVEESGTFWLSDTPEVPNSMTWGNQITRIVTWARANETAGARTVHFFNTHFDHQSQPSREKSAALLAERIAARKPAGPFVLTGDFNATPDNPAITALTDGPLKLVDAWKVAHPNTPAAESGTWQAFNGNRDGGRIDFVLVPPETRIIDAAILHDAPDGVLPSDHFPVRGTVEFAP
ncbi:MAG: endonuclease/exonuclease/phosphatase family protein [Verrucomicrobiales bacterium]